MKNHTLELLRLSLNLNKKELAKQLEITQNTYTNYINGKREIPTGLSLKIKQMYDISIDWLLTGKGEMLIDTSSDTTIGDVSIKNLKGGNNIIGGTGDINISNHKKEVSNKEDELLESYRILPAKKQDYYYHRIKGDALEVEMKED